MVWKPAKALGLAAGLIVGTAVFSALLLVARSARAQTWGPGLFITLVLAALGLILLGLWAHWLWALFRLRYELDRNEIVIHAATGRWVVPLTEISGVAAGESYAALADRFRGLNWPGYQAGRIPLDDGRTLWVHATALLAKQVVIVTPQGCFGISPSEPKRFLDDLASRQALGPIRDVAFGFTPTGPITWQVWHSRAFWGTVGLILALNLLLWGYLAARLGMLSGHAATLAGRYRFWMLPGIAGLVWLGNGLLGVILFRLDRTASFLLQGVSALVLVVLGLAVFGIPH